RRRSTTPSGAAVAACVPEHKRRAGGVRTFTVRRYVHCLARRPPRPRHTQEDAMGPGAIVRGSAVLVVGASLLIAQAPGGRERAGAVEASAPATRAAPAVDRNSWTSLEQLLAARVVRTGPVAAEAGADGRGTAAPAVARRTEDAEPARPRSDARDGR